MMKWTEKAWLEIEETYAKILDLSFIKELISGDLARDKFEFYLQQDSLYLAEFGKVLAGIAVKLEKAEDRQAFLGFAKDTVEVEQALHQFYLKDMDQTAEASPSCLLYTSYIHKQLMTASVEEVAAAVLPCFWIYKKVGDYILDQQIKNKNPYQNWIDTYGGEEFALAVEKAIDICNQLAEQTTNAMQLKMTDAFVMASKMEWMFWDSAYRKEDWPV